MIKFDKNEFLKPQIYSTLDEYESRCNVTKEIIEEIEQLQQENQKYKEVIDKATNELFILKDMIYKPETREENFEIQRKISSIIKRLNGKEVE